MFALAVMVAAIAAPFASASQLIDRNAVGVKLTVNAKGEALLTYRKGGKVMRVLAWGAVDAVAPTDDAPQTELEARLRRRLGQVLRQRSGGQEAAGQLPAAEAQRPAVPEARRPSSSSRRSRPSPATTRRSRSAARARSTRARPSRGSSPRAPRPTAATGPCRAGSARSRTTAWMPTRRSPSGSCGSRTGRPTCPVLTIADGLVVAQVGSPLRHVHLPRRARLRLRFDPDRPAARRLRAQPLRRHVRLGVRRGLEAREQLPHAQGRRVSSATASTRTAPTRPARA